eukprot:TRINITY_DN13600_c0_g1_i1.p1 TRINITY_DN13600_c0_g1~~TRINITY_DN13600_c0_g1_i1.p1  ORF type:complete len:557 (-),score=60.10 TRINITY_DN13600_c0_g1_i1:322-1992(-)
MHSPGGKDACSGGTCDPQVAPDKCSSKPGGGLMDEVIDEEVVLLDNMLNNELESDEGEFFPDEGSESEEFGDISGMFEDDDDDGDDFDDDEIASQDSGEDDFHELSDESFASQYDASEDSEAELAAESCSHWMAIRAENMQVKLSKPGAASALRQRVQQVLQKRASEHTSSVRPETCLKWEHALVFDDCPPLLGVHEKRHTRCLAKHLADLEIDVAWPREESSVDSATKTHQKIMESLKARCRFRDNAELRNLRKKEADEPLRARSRSRDGGLPRQSRSMMRSAARSRSDWQRAPPPSVSFKTDSDDHVPCESGEDPKVAVDRNGVLVIYKPAFWTVTVGKDRFKKCTSCHPKLQDWLRDTLGWQYPFLSSNARAGLIHRLDVQTSGPILVGSNMRAFKHLRMNLHLHNFFKEYVALMHGAIPISKSFGSMDYPLLTFKEGGESRTQVDKRGEDALTHYEAIARYRSATRHGKTQRYTLVRLQLITGKTHQIRVHLMELAQQLGLKVCGIVSDYKYLPPKIMKLDTQLCSRVFSSLLASTFSNARPIRWQQVSSEM